MKNHDELSLDKLSEGEREEVFAALAPDEDRRIYGRASAAGSRPCWTATADGWSRVQPAVRPAGHPVLLYGEEIGLGDDLSIEGRGSVRVPMRWDERPASAATRGRCSTGWKAGPDPQGDPGAGLGLVPGGPGRRPGRSGGALRLAGSVVLTLHNLADRPVEAQVGLEGR